MYEILRNIEFLSVNNVTVRRKVFGVAIAWVVLLFFAAERRKSYWSGHIKVANGDFAISFSEFWYSVLVRINMIF